MPRTTRRPTVEEIDAAIEAVRAKAEKEIATPEQKKTHVQASHFQRITRVARDAGCDLTKVSDTDLIAALKALAAPFRGPPTGSSAASRVEATSPEAETPHGKRRSA